MRTIFNEKGRGMKKRIVMLTSILCFVAMGGAYGSWMHMTNLTGSITTATMNLDYPDSDQFSVYLEKNEQQTKLPFEIIKGEHKKVSLILKDFSVEDTEGQELIIKYPLLEDDSNTINQIKEYEETSEVSFLPVEVTISRNSKENAIVYYGEHEAEKYADRQNLQMKTSITWEEDKYIVMHRISLTDWKKNTLKEDETNLLNIYKDQLSEEMGVSGNTTLGTIHRSIKYSFEIPVVYMQEEGEDI